MRFDNLVYTTLHGSLALCAYICGAVNSKGKRPTWLSISKKTKELMQRPEKRIPFDDKDYINKTLALYDMERPPTFPIALIMGEYNNLFALYIDNQILPLREDGVMTRTLTAPQKIIPIKF